MTESETDNQMILVTGATGKQGGAVARSLLESGFAVRALVRDPQKPGAKALAEAGAELARGDLDEKDSIERALEGAYGVFSVQNFFQAGYEGEIQQGTMLADLSEAAGISHFVYSSVGSAHRHTGIHHFESKRHIEDHVRTKELPYTILRPVFFMHNWEGMREQILSGVFSSPLSPERTLQQLAVEDHGAIAARAFANPQRWIGRELEIAGDELTMPQNASAFGRIAGRQVHHIQVPWEEFRQSAGQEIYDMYLWFEHEGYEADIEALRVEHPELSTLTDYLQRHGWGE